jgi:hypothetical protein
VTDRVDPPFVADELATFLGFLDFQRATLLTKCEGLTDDQLRVRLPSSSLTLAGLLKHGALNEDWWFSHRFAGVPVLEPWSAVDFDADPEWEFRTALEQPGDEVRAMYVAACERSRAVVAGRDAAELAVNPMRNGELPTLRWIVGHMIEEVARHNGHADLLREAVDGTTGE